MTETTTQNIRWLTDGGTERDKSTTSLFPTGSGHILFKQVAADPTADSNWWSKFRQPPIGVSTIAIHPPVVPIPRAKKVSNQPANRYILLKKYDGFVLSREETAFTARLFENGKEYPVMDAEFDLEELSDTDRHLAVQGASLVWTIGYHENGPRRRESLIYLRRRPAWNEKETKEENAAAEALTSDIGWK